MPSLPRATERLALVERVAAFCASEVTRQGHNVFDQDDGGIRLAWMLNAWEFAMLGAPQPSLTSVQTLGRLVEPGRNATGFRTCNVMVGRRVCPPWQEVRSRMENLMQCVPSVIPIQGRGIDLRNPGMTADDFYVAFEEIHPFVDGNGRVGKIVHNWLLGTLDAPVLVADYFGGGNP